MRCCCVVEGDGIRIREEMGFVCKFLQVFPGNDHCCKRWRQAVAVGVLGLLWQWFHPTEKWVKVFFKSCTDCGDPFLFARSPFHQSLLTPPDWHVIVYWLSVVVCSRTRKHKISIFLVSFSNYNFLSRSVIFKSVRKSQFYNMVREAHYLMSSK